MNNDIGDIILTNVFGGNVERIYPCFTYKYKNKPEVEFRLDNETFWNVYDEYLKEYTGLMDDIIITYQNRNFNVSNVIYREYKYGKVKQRKTLLTKFNVSNGLIPFICKVSDEKNINTMGDLIPKSYTRTCRQSFKIRSNKYITQRSKQYIKNWCVDKTLRFPRSTLNEAYNIHIKNINDYTMADKIDIEFEFIGEWSTLKPSILALVEFLYLSNPHYKCYFNKVCYDYIYYGQHTMNKPKILTLNVDIRDFKQYVVPCRFKPCYIIHINVDNYMIIKTNEIILTNYKETSDDYILKFGFYDTNNEKLLTDEKDTLTDTYYVKNDEIYYVPSTFKIYLKTRVSVNMNKLELFCFNNVLFNVPYFQDYTYTPEDKTNIFKYDDKVCKFVLYINDNFIVSIRLVKIKNNEQQASTFSEAVNILESFYMNNFTTSNVTTNDDEILKRFNQIIIEQIPNVIYKNIMIYEEGSFSHSLNMFNNFVDVSNIVLKSTSTNIIRHIQEYYEKPKLTPTQQYTSFQINHANIYTLNEFQDIYNIDKYYKNDMDLIYVCFTTYKNLYEFVLTFTYILENVKICGIVVFNYIRQPNNEFLKFRHVNNDLFVYLKQRLNDVNTSDYTKTCLDSIAELLNYKIKYIINDIYVSAFIET